MSQKSVAERSERIELLSHKLNNLEDELEQLTTKLSENQALKSAQPMSFPLAKK